MASVLEETNAPVTGLQSNGASGKGWDEARLRLECYLRAWRLPRERRRELSEKILGSVRARLADESATEILPAVIAEADKLLAARLRDIAMSSSDAGDNKIGVEDRVKLLFAGLPETWEADGSDLRIDQVAYARATAAVQTAHNPQRAPETHPMKMRTSLTRLPSLRMIAGWFLLITLLFLAFIVTH
jgi:hypothetical protein